MSPLIESLRSVKVVVFDAYGWSFNVGSIKPDLAIYRAVYQA